MKNIIKNKINALALLAIAALFTGLVSCSDTNNPLGSFNQKNNSGLTSSDNSLNNNYTTDENDNNSSYYAFGGKDSDKRKDTTKDSKGKDVKKRALPLPCLNLSTEQMSALASLRKDTETKNAQLRKEFELQVKALRDAALAANGGTTSTINKDSINKIITYLLEKEKANNEKLSASEKEFKAKMDALSARYKEALKTVGDDKEARKALEEKMKAEKAAMYETYMKETQQLRETQKEIKTKLEQTKRALADCKEGTNRLSAEVKARLDAEIKGLTERLNSAIEANEKAALEAFRNLLTPEQQAIFDAWLAGKDCDKVVKKETK
ncbi:MAG: hypothetical protein NTW25_08515 [Candidatus Kapabacteria bacterium]|nr:hypothetical protein [Candidatus Kapabacteria bacterium]